MSKKLSTSEWIERARAKHGDRYDYSKTVYESAGERLEILCRKHGSFWQKASNHTQGKGCPGCRTDAAVAGKTTPIAKIKESLATAHGIKYIYFLEGKTNWKNIKFLCPTHGIVEQSYPWHLKTGCMQCRGDYFLAKRSVDLTWDELVTYVDADIETGTLRHKIPYKKKQTGDLFNITIDSKGYQVCSLLCRTFYVHRVIWSFAQGQLLEDSLSIDHINSVPHDNRISNLRAVTHMENQQNMRLRKDNKTGVCGVQYLKNEKKYVAHITYNKKIVYLGRFNTIEEATAARKAAEIKYGFHPLHGMPAEEKALQ